MEDVVGACGEGGDRAHLSWWTRRATAELTIDHHGLASCPRGIQGRLRHHWVVYWPYREPNVPLARCADVAVRDDRIEHVEPPDVSVVDSRPERRLGGAIGVGHLRDQRTWEEHVG